MIAFLTGRVAVRTPGSAVVDVGGVGFRLLMTTRSLDALPAVGDEVTVHTYLHVRESELTLFGFENTAERDGFEALLTVTGVGPKVALATLSALGAAELATAVASQDVAAISSVPGVGKKTAQRIILDLADRLGVVGDEVTARGQVRSADGAAEARDALLAMGFSASEIAVALKGAPGGGDVQVHLKYALQRLGGGA